MRSSLKRSCLFGLVLCSAVLLCLTHGAAQSGRRNKKPADAVPAPALPQQNSAPETPAVPITAIIIAGHDIDPDTKEIWSNDTSAVAEACSDKLKEHPKFHLEIIYNGKMTKTAAVERAKKETSSYVLWFGYRSKLVGLDYIIDYLDYVVLMPQTAKTLTEGRVYPGQQKTSADPGGILRLPSRRTSRNPAANRRLLRLGGEQIADRIKGIL